MKNLIPHYDNEQIKEKIPYYPHSLYIFPVILAALVALLYYLFKNITMDKLHNIIDRLRRIELKLLKKETEINPTEETE